MINSVVPLTNMQTYIGNLKIHIADGTLLSITVVCDIFSSLANIFVSPNLSTNLVFMGHLVYNGCQVKFSQFSYVV